MLENYLLCPEAIVAALAELNLDLAPSFVDKALCKALSIDKLSDDLSEVDAAQTLKEVFSELSEATLEFRKTRDVPVIFGHFIKNNPEHLEPLRLLLRSLFELH